MENADWLEWWMGAASFTLTALTGLLAMLALFGFVLIKRHVEKIAKEVSDEAVSKYMSPENIQKMLQREVEKASDKMFESMPPFGDLESISQQEESK